MPQYQKIIFVFLSMFAYLVNPVAAQEVLSWDDCLREAAKNHPDLIASNEGVVQSRNSKSIAVSGLFPQVTASASLSADDSERSGSSKSSSIGLSANQLLFDGLKTVQGTRAASENIKAARESYRFTSSQVRFRLRSAFIDLLKAQALIKITEDIYNIRRDNLQLISLRYESGTEHRGALLTAQANLASAEFGKNQAQRALEVAQWELTKELGRQEFVPFKVDGDFAVTQDTDVNPDFLLIAEQHPNVLKILADKNAASYDVKSSRGEFFPTVSLQGDAGKTGADWPPGDNGSGVALRFTVPVFEAGLRMAQLSQSKSVYRQLMANEKSTKDSIMLTLQQSWRDLKGAIENIGVQEKFLVATQERAKISEAQYSVGLVSFDNWTIIGDDLVRQKQSYLDAQANALLAQARWVEAKGETLEYEK